MVETGEYVHAYVSASLVHYFRLAPNCTGGVERQLRKGRQDMASLRGDVALKLDCIAAVTSECLLMSVEKDIPCPRLMMVSEDVSRNDVSPESDESRLSHFRREMMDKMFLGKGPAPQHYRIRFLCAYDLSAATCGEDGLGYKVEIGGWKGWLQKFMPVIQVSYMSDASTRCFRYFVTSLAEWSKFLHK